MPRGLDPGVTGARRGRRWRPWRLRRRAGQRRHPGSRRRRRPGRRGGIMPAAAAARQRLPRGRGPAATAAGTAPPGPRRAGPEATPAPPTAGMASAVVAASRLVRRRRGRRLPERKRRRRQRRRRVQPRRHVGHRRHVLPGRRKPAAVGDDYLQCAYRHHEQPAGRNRSHGLLHDAGGSGRHRPADLVGELRELPDGLKISSSGTISGTPQAAGTFSFTVQVTDSSALQQTATQDLSIVIAKAGTATKPEIDPSMAAVGDTITLSRHFPRRQRRPRAGRDGDVHRQRQHGLRQHPGHERLRAMHDPPEHGGHLLGHRDLLRRRQLHRQLGHQRQLPGTEGRRPPGAHLSRQQAERRSATR